LEAYIHSFVFLGAPSWLKFLFLVVSLIRWFNRLPGLKSDIGTEEIYHKGEEGARKAGIGSAYTFLRVPGDPQLALVRLCG
jgi:hypothetical protein